MNGPDREKKTEAAVGMEPAMDRALEAGLRTGQSVARALRRVSDLAPLPIRNGLALAQCHVEEALFAIEQAAGVEGSVGECIGNCGRFVEGYRAVLASEMQDGQRRGMLQDGLEEAEEALEGLSLLVDGYLSFTGGDT